MSTTRVEGRPSIIEGNIEGGDLKIIKSIAISGSNHEERRNF